MCNQIYMVRKSELRIKHGTEVTHTSREGYVREERGELLTVNFRELPVTTEPDGLSLRGIEKKAVSSHPGSNYVSSLTHLRSDSFRSQRISMNIGLDIISK